MKKIGIVALLCCACALCVALVGCGGSSTEENDADAAKAAFAGSWNLTTMSQAGVDTGSDDIEMLAALGMKVTLDLNDDGTAKLTMFEDSMAGTWEASSATTGTATLDGQAIDMTIDNELLTMTEGDYAMTFKKGEAKASAAPAETATSSESVDAATDEAAEASEESSDAA